MSNPIPDFVHMGAPRVLLANTVARTLLARTPAESVDLVLTDPPYIISKKSGFQNKVKGTDHAGGNPQFAISLDYGAWDREGEGFTMADLEEAVNGLIPVLKPGGTAVVFFDLWKISPLVEMMEAAGFQNVTMIEWQKTNAVPINSRKTYLSNAREVAIVGHKEGEPIYNIQNPDGIYYGPIYSGKERFHPTQKSLSVFEELVLTHTNQDGVVLDCFSGSATTGAAALTHGRSYLGCEPDPDYFAKSVDRLKRHI